LALSSPLIASQLGQMMIGVVDTIMVGHINNTALAAASLGHAWSHAVLFMILGVAMSVDPLISQAHGAGSPEGVALAFQRGMVLAFALSIPASILWLLTEPALLLFRQDPTLAHMAGQYVSIQVPTLWAFFLFNVNRMYLAGRGISAPYVWAVLLANLLNVLFNWLLVFGNWGFPAMGIEGAGIAGAITRLVLAVSLMGLTFGTGLHRDAWIPWTRKVFDLRAIGNLVRLGLPIGLQFGFEAWAFQIATLIAGKLGANELGAHTIVLNLAALAFMVPLGLSMGASVRVGNLIGAGDIPGAIRNARLSLWLGAGVMGLSAAIFLVFRHQLPVLYGAEPAVAALAVSIFPIAAAFQLFDGLQVVGSGILRGMAQTRPSAVFNFVGYYVLALPLAYWMSFHTGARLRGLWWGLALGLAFVAVALVVWINRTTRKPETWRSVQAPGS
jgi:multidrug resistance protein, MATE family